MTQYFPAKLSKTSTFYSVEGTTENISQGGAYIKTGDWRAFQVRDETMITVILPPAFSGQEETIGLYGTGVITRVDEDNEAIAIHFLKHFKQFERVALEESAELRYRKVAEYLLMRRETSPADFIAAHPHGVLIEKASEILDGEVIFRFGTQVIEEQDLVDRLERAPAPAPARILEARVIEIRKRKADSEAEIVTIGRSAKNDIILYNQTISRAHACLYLAPSFENPYLADVGSANGTFVNGNRLVPSQKRQLEEADEISFGPHVRLLYLSARAFHDFLSEQGAQSF
jgi:hypothetical protein